jgi:hypothetical protein
VRKTDNLPPSCADVKKSGGLNLLEHRGPVQACNGTALFYLIPKATNAHSEYVILVAFPLQQMLDKCLYGWVTLELCNNAVPAISSNEVRVGGSNEHDATPCSFHSYCSVPCTLLVKSHSVTVVYLTHSLLRATQLL